MSHNIARPRSTLPATSLLAALLLGPVTADAQDPEEPAAPDTAAVLEATRAVLEGISAGDTTLLRSVTAPDLRLESTTTRGSPPATAAGQSRGEFLAMVARPDVDFVERMWSPTVRVRGRIADVRASYDFYEDGEFSHCGIDLFQLVKTSEGWKVVSIVWTVEQPPDCQRHPDGPPAGGGGTKIDG